MGKKKEKKENKEKSKVEKRLEKEKIKEEKKRNKGIEVHLLYEEIPLLDYQFDIKSNAGYGILEDGSLMDLISIKGKDLASMAEEDIDYDNYVWSKAYRQFDKDDLKIIVQNFPTDTAAQIEYHVKKYEEQKNPVLREYIGEQIELLKWLSFTRTDREFMIAIFGEDKETLDRKRRELVSVLSMPETPLFEFIPHSKKMKIFFKIMNKNTAIAMKEGEI